MEMNQDKFYIFTAVIAACAGLAFGYGMSVISGAILFITDELHLNVETTSLVVSAVLLGAVIGGVISGRSADHFGRKTMLMTDAVIFIIGTGLTIIATTVTELVIGRLIVGIGIGLATYVAPIYISETAPREKRGVLVALNQLAITTGILIAYLVNYLFASTENWRAMLAAGLIPSCLLLIGAAMLPKSPRWLLSKGHEDNARKVLTQLRGCTSRVNDEVKQIKSSLQQQRGTWSMLISKNIRPAFYIAVGLAFFQQTSGIGVMLFYAPTIFKFAGFQSASAAILATVGLGGRIDVIHYYCITVTRHLGAPSVIIAGGQHTFNQHGAVKSDVSFASSHINFKMDCIN